ncbi:MAG: hypothetical protein EJNHJLOP_00031 [Methanophagales virus PBV082]|uniref:Uncharacterized protein n=1 Tax=Methanophagales virus PBV082 TaxID=3071307 RepID=A0AA46TDH3_9VIRU|nr:MAG: hypothetical protein QIT52_gp31 [Methanophagales virus PBV082]UYL64920.1 MAG: hypothetical protein EJNHJLOP_00031 [Methanophagales virus PBV082]
MVLNILLEAYMRRGELDKLHGIMKMIREVERKQLRYLDRIWKTFGEGGDVNEIEKGEERGNEAKDC